MANLDNRPTMTSVARAALAAVVAYDRAVLAKLDDPDGRGGERALEHAESALRSVADAYHSLGEVARPGVTRSYRRGQLRDARGHLATAYARVASTEEWVIACSQLEAN